MIAFLLMSGWLKNIPAKFTGQFFASQFEFDVGDCDFRKGAEVGIGSESAVSCVGTSLDGDWDGVVFEVFIVFLTVLGFEVEDKGFVFLYVVDFVIGVGLLIAVEMVSFYDSFLFFFGLDLLVEFFLHTSAGGDVD